MDYLGDLGHGWTYISTREKEVYMLDGRIVMVSDLSTKLWEPKHPFVGATVVGLVRRTPCTNQYENCYGLVKPGMNLWLCSEDRRIMPTTVIFQIFKVCHPVICHEAETLVRRYRCDLLPQTDQAA